MRTRPVADRITGVPAWSHMRGSEPGSRKLNTGQLDHSVNGHNRCVQIQQWPELHGVSEHELVAGRRTLRQPSQRLGSGLLQ